MSNLILLTLSVLKRSTWDSQTGGTLPDQTATIRPHATAFIKDRIAAMRAWFGPYIVVAEIAAIVVAYFTVLRTVMLFAFADVSELSIWQVFRLFLTGLRFDVLVACCFALPQILHLTVTPNRRVGRPISRWLLQIEWLIAFLFPPFLCLAEYIFFAEFESRLNYIAFEYIVYPTEVCCNIWQSYPIFDLLAVVMLCGVILWLLLRRAFLKRAVVTLPWRRRYGILAVGLLGIAVLWSTTSASSRQLTRNRVANESAWNGLYSFVYYAWTCHFDFDQNYITLNDADATQRLRQQVIGSKDRLIPESNNPVDRVVTTGKPQRELNVVLILEESLGSSFVGALGDERGLTPQFDALTRDGTLFDNFYATGNRTARALEAVLTSMPPIPTESILKRDHSNRVHTLANVLADRGYERLFMTGGRGLFDGVRSFMKANGFNRFVEQSDIRDPIFTNAWGVCDEDLFRTALHEIDDLHATGRPFLATILTVSNHRPYTYPEGRIPETAQTRENAVKYADWALGYFFREARQHPFYRNTLFVVLGDHGARVYGSQLFPMRSYRVPVLMISPDAKTHQPRCDTLACLLDIAPTIMGRLGGDYRSVFFGYDALIVDPAKGRAVMQHNHDVALLDVDSRLQVLGFGKTAHTFLFDPDTHELHQQESPNQQMQSDAAALFQSAYQLYYSDRWFPDARQRHHDPCRRN